MRFAIAAALALAAFSFAARAEIPLQAFVQHDDVDQISISPDGRHLAVVLPMADRHSIGIFSLPDLKPKARMQTGVREQVGRLWWSDNERLMHEVAVRYDAASPPVPTGELGGVDIDGQNDAIVFGHRARQPMMAAARVISRLRDDPGHLLVEVWRGTPEGEQMEVMRLDSRRGYRKAVAKAPIKGSSDFLADENGVVRYVSVLDLDNQLRTFYRDKADEAWRPENVEELQGADLEPLAFGQDGRSVYLDSNEGGDKSCLVRRDLAAGKRESLACDPESDLGGVVWSFDRDEPIAAIFNAGRPEMRFLPGEHPHQAVMRGLSDALAAHGFVRPVSASEDGSKVVLFAHSDRNPGRYYLYDGKSGEVRHLMTRRPGIDPATMAERQPVRYPARDGSPVHGYLTLPQGKQAKDLPLLVLPHGGPFDVRDYWGWDAEAQLFASRGYAVLQANFRGSSGYGRKHRDDAMQAWGTTMINDITDGVRWLLAQKKMDPARVCIYGTSYGGYAAVMSAVREPDLYRCVIANAGVYDLNLLKAHSDFPEWTQGRNYFEDFIGSDKAQLAAHSPIGQVGRLKAPVFVIHGELDRRAPFNQAKALRTALEQHKLPYEWLARADEGHGFFKEKNRIEQYERTLAFLDRHIGKPPGTASPQ